MAALAGIADATGIAGEGFALGRWAGHAIGEVAAKSRGRTSGSSPLPRGAGAGADAAAGQLEAWKATEGAGGASMSAGTFEVEDGHGGTMGREDHGEDPLDWGDET